MTGGELTLWQLYILYVNFIQGFRKSNPKVAQEFIPLSLEVFEYSMRRLTERITEKEKAALIKQWQQGWESVNPKLKNEVFFWKCSRCIVIDL